MGNPILRLYDDDGAINWNEVSLLEFVRAARALSHTGPHLMSVKDVDDYDMESVKGLIQDARDHLAKGGQ